MGRPAASFLISCITPQLGQRIVHFCNSPPDNLLHFGTRSAFQRKIEHHKVEPIFSMSQFVFALGNKGSEASGKTLYFFGANLLKHIFLVLSIQNRTSCIVGMPNVVRSFETEEIIVKGFVYL